MLLGTQVSLGPVLESDGAIFFRWRNTPGLMHLDGLYRPCSQAEFDGWFRGIGRSPAQVVFAIRTLDQAQLVGYLEVREIQPLNRSADISIMIGDAVNWGRGYGRDALGLAVGFCWKELNLQRLSMVVMMHNQRALRAYRAAGFQEEGRMRQALYSDGQFVDLVLMARLRSDTAEPVPA